MKEIKHRERRSEIERKKEMKQKMGIDDDVDFIARKKMYTQNCIQLSKNEAKTKQKVEK